MPKINWIWSTEAIFLTSRTVFICPASPIAAEDSKSAEEARTWTPVSCGERLFETNTKKTTWELLKGEICVVGAKKTDHGGGLHLSKTVNRNNIDCAKSLVFFCVVCNTCACCICLGWFLDRLRHFGNLNNLNSSSLCAIDVCVVDLDFSCEHFGFLCTGSRFSLCVLPKKTNKIHSQKNKKTKLVLPSKTKTSMFWPKHNDLERLSKRLHKQREPKKRQKTSLSSFSFFCLDIRTTFLIFSVAKGIIFKSTQPVHSSLAGFFFAFFSFLFFFLPKDGDGGSLWMTFGTNEDGQIPSLSLTHLRCHKRCWLSSPYQPTPIHIEKQTQNVFPQNITIFFSPFLSFFFLIFALLCVFVFDIYSFPEFRDVASLNTIPMRAVSDLAFSHDGRYMVTRDVLCLRVWDTFLEARPVATHGRIVITNQKKGWFTLEISTIQCLILITRTTLQHICQSPTPTRNMKHFWRFKT